MLNIKTQYLTNNRNYQTKRSITVEGLILHSIGCPQPSAQAIANSWNNQSCQVGIHGFIDNNQAIITLPCLEVTDTSGPGKAHRAWHIGSGSNGSFNNNRIGIEMTEPSCIKYTQGATFTCSDPEAARKFVYKNLENAVELFAQLCIYHNLNPLGKNAILSHKEAHALGYGSNHGDPSHLFTQLNMDYSMDKFRQEVNKRVQELKTPVITNPIISELEDDDMTQEKFNEYMNNYLASLWTNDAGTWSQEARDWAVKSGLIGGSGQVDANGNPIYMWPSSMTREQFVTVLYRYAKLMGQA